MANEKTFEVKVKIVKTFIIGVGITPGEDETEEELQARAEADAVKAIKEAGFFITDSEHTVIEAVEAKEVK